MAFKWHAIHGLPCLMSNEVSIFIVSGGISCGTHDGTAGKVDATSSGSATSSSKSSQTRPVSRPASGSVRSADSTDWIASAVTRRFGLAGGLAWVGFLTFGVVSEQLKTRREVYLEESNTR